MQRNPTPPQSPSLGTALERALQYNRGINADELTPEEISKLVNSAKNALDSLTQKKDGAISLLEKAQQAKNQVLLNEYYQRAVAYYTNTRTGEIDVTTFDNVKHLRTILFWAVATFQDAALIDQLIQKGCDPEEKHYDDNTNGVTTFTLALKLGHTAAMGVLLKHSTRLLTEKIDQFGSTPAHYAVKEDNTEILEVLAKVNPIISRAPTGPDELTPLHTAAILGKVKTAKWLLDNDEDNVNRNSDIPDKRGFTALHFAARNGHEEIIDLLLAHHADTSLCAAGKSALEIAADHGHNNITRQLMNHEVTRNAVGIADFSRLMEITKSINSSKLNTDLQVAFGLLKYLRDSEGQPEYKHTVAGRNLNPYAWSKIIKTNAAKKVLEAILSNVANPFSQLSPEEDGALKDKYGNLKAVVQPLLDLHKPGSNHSSPNNSARTSPSPKPSSQSE